MRPAICTGFDPAVPFAESVAMIVEAGFQAIAIGARPEHSGYDTADGRRRIAALVDDCRVRVDSVHAPFPEGDRLCSLDEAERSESIRQCEVAIDAAEELGTDVVVIHLNTDADASVRERMLDRGFGSMASLSEHALGRGVRLALENSWGEPYAEMLHAIMGEFAEAPVGFCFDAGHGNVDGVGVGDLLRYGDRLLTVHLHDNLGTDAHMLPYEGNMDWGRIIGALRDVGYRGNLLLEVATHDSEFKDAGTFLSQAHGRAERLLRE